MGEVEAKGGAGGDITPSTRDSGNWTVNNTTTSIANNASSGGVAGGLLSSMNDVVDSSGTDIRSNADITQVDGNHNADGSRAKSYEKTVTVVKTIRQQQ